MYHLVVPGVYTPTVSNINHATQPARKWCAFSCRAAQQTEQPSSSCYKGEDKTLGQFLGLDESKKVDNPALEPILGCFHSLHESKKCLPYPELIL
jgi:hypothetical protein